MPAGLSVRERCVRTGAIHEHGTRTRPIAEHSHRSSPGIGVMTVCVVTAFTDMTNWKAVQEFQSRCEDALFSGPPLLVLDLTEVRSVDSKLVACLVVIARRARALAVSLEIKASVSVRGWMALCRLDALVRSEAREDLPGLLRLTVTLARSTPLERGISQAPSTT